jgi:biopolymer transport protein TolR
MPFGRFERQPNAEPMSEINVTPLVDVMLVLVVILIVTAPLMGAALRLELPSAASAAPVPAGGAPLVLSLEGPGQLRLDGQALDESTLAQRLRAVAALDPDTELHLHADRRVPYGEVLRLLDLAQTAGLSRIAFAAEKPESR